MPPWPAFGRFTRTSALNTVSFVVEGADSIALMACLDLEGICASSGSACSAGSLEPSHVVSALGVEKNLANSLVRFSLGRDSTEEEVQLSSPCCPKWCGAQKVPSSSLTACEHPPTM
jgi:cysteine sulfinate desulfinase/cysteine desulfurase-like protein